MENTKLPSPLTPKNGRLRFNMEDDLRTLREVALQNPFLDSSRWRTVHYNVTSNWKPYTVRGVKEHVEHLLKLYTKKDAGNICKGGTPVQVREKTLLLREIKRMQLEAKRELYPQLDHDDVHDALQMMNSLSPSLPKQEDAELHGTEVTPMHQRPESPSQSSAHLEEEEVSIDTKPNIDFLETPEPNPDLLNNSSHHQVTYSGQNYSGQDVARKRLELDERRMNLEERRLALEERKFEADKMDRERRLDMEFREREARIRLREQQQDIIKSLLAQLQRD